jgi:hypothetical protein
VPSRRRLPPAAVSDEGSLIGKTSVRWPRTTPSGSRFPGYLGPPGTSSVTRARPRSVRRTFSATTTFIALENYSRSESTDLRTVVWHHSVWALVFPFLGAPATSSVTRAPPRPSPRPPLPRPPPSSPSRTTPGQIRRNAISGLPGTSCLILWMAGRASAAIGLSGSAAGSVR